MAIQFGLTAKNSSGAQVLHFAKNESGGIDLTLTGKYNSNDIQIDFDTLDKVEARELVFLLTQMGNL